MRPVHGSAFQPFNQLGYATTVDEVSINEIEELTLEPGGPPFLIFLHRLPPAGTSFENQPFGLVRGIRHLDEWFELRQVLPASEPIGTVGSYRVPVISDRRPPRTFSFVAPAASTF